MPIPRLRGFAGPAILSYGFRPFFLFGALYAALAIAIWLPIFFGALELPTAFGPLAWHIHEMLFGYLAAVITGFLLTAIPNWTGRLPLQGMPLLVLVIVWMLGRLAVACSDRIGWVATAAVDCGFLILVALAAGREIISGRNWRNLKVLIPVLVLALSNVGFHIEAHRGVTLISASTAIAAVVLLIMLIGGRIVPSFTRNWLARQAPGRMPGSLGRFDMLAIAVAVVALLAWVVSPEGKASAVLLGLAALMQFVRLARWAGERTVRDRLVLVLHVGYAFIPIGFALAAAGALNVVPQSAAFHAFMVGAAGVMTLAVMTRATLGHTGRALAASPATQVLYGLVALAAACRIVAALRPDWTVLLYVAAVAWCGAFFGFAAVYGPMLIRPRRT